MSFNYANYVRLDIPQGRVKKIHRKGDNLVLWTAGYVNQVPLSINADGTIYNGTGYKYGYRIRSGGAEAAVAYTVVTGYIPVAGGDVIRVSGYDFNQQANQNAINVSNSSFENIGQIVGNFAHAGYGIFATTGGYTNYAFNTVTEEAPGVYRWQAPPAESGIAYIRITSMTTKGNSGDATGKNLIVTVNEEIV